MADTEFHKKGELEEFQDFHSGYDPSFQSGEIGDSEAIVLESPPDGKERGEAGEDEEGGGGGGGGVGGSWLAVLTLEYYQGFFDVTTKQVCRRVLAGMIPLYFSLVDTLRPNPDLYGPFWLAMTLVFTTAVSGNIASAFQNSEHWEFHFREVTLLGSVVCAYTWLIPSLLWLLLWWRGNRQRYTLLQLLAIYGYSIAIFIPLTLLWMINIDILRWLLLCIGTLLSGSVLVLALWKPLSKDDNKKLATVVVVLVFLMHAALSISFKFYYFSSALGGGTDRDWLSTGTGQLSPTAASNATDSVTNTTSSPEVFKTQ